MGTMINSITFGSDTYPLSLPYGVCGIAAGTAAKTVTVDNFYLETGASVMVKFTYANTVANPTLNVNSTGAKAIYWHGAALASSQYWQAGATLQFVYNGTQWELIGIAKDNNSTYTVNNATITIDAGTKLNTGGNFTANQSSNKTITINHDETSRTDGTATAVSPGYAGTFTVIDSVSSDATGHITGIKTKTVTMPSVQDLTGYQPVGDYKTVQTAVSSPATSGSATAFIDTISQNTNGVITTTKKNIPSAIKNPHALTIAGKTYDGSSAVSITAADFGITGPMNFKGTVTALPAVASSTSGDVVIFGNKEYVFDGSTWIELGDEGSHALKTITISAGAELTGGGTLAANRTIAHATKLSAAYTSGNTTTSISGSGASATIKIPQLTVNTYGHVTAATDESVTITMPTLPTSLKNPNALSIANNGTAKLTYDGSAAKTLDFDNGTNTTAVVDASGNVKINVPSASGTQAGVTIVYPAASCTTFASDSGTVTPAAVQKGAKMFAITRPTSSTTDNIVRFSNTTGDVKDSLIKIEDVTNTRDSSLQKQVITIPAEGDKKMVYGYCTDQVDGTSFIGGVFPADATEYPYSSGLAIGGTSGNLLWKGKQVATTDMIPTDTNTTKVTAGTGLTGGGSAASSTGVTISHGTNLSAAYTSGNTTTSISGSGASATIKIPQLTVNTLGHVTAAADESITITMPTTPSLTKGTDSNSGTTNLSHGGTFTVMVDTTVNGHTITDKTTTFKLPSETTLSEGTNGTATKTLSHSGTFTAITDIAVSGHTVTPTVTTFTMPSDNNTDTKVTQKAAITTAGNYPVILGYSTATTEITNTVNKCAAITANPSTGALTATNVYGAVWNDYAEYRQSDCLEAGRVICENGDDTLSLATERLQPGAEIISDTFGFAIGKTDKAQTPIAVSGRVLAYTYEDRNQFKPGDAVCAAPNGTVSIMTREEIREYPERIIGTVSAIPEYKTWGEGNVAVNGRIWIKIK